MEAAVVFLCEEALSETWRMGGYGRTIVTLAEKLSNEQKVIVLCSLENMNRASVLKRHGVIYIVSPFGYGYENKFKATLLRWIYFVPHRLWIRKVIQILGNKKKIFVECAEYGSEWLFLPKNKRDHIRFHTPSWFDRDTRKIRSILKVSAVDWPTYLFERYLLKRYLGSWRVKSTVGTRMVHDLSFFTNGLECKVNYFEVISGSRGGQRSIDIVFVGSVVEEKGVFDLIPIARSFENTFGRKPKVVIIGHGRKNVIQTLQCSISCTYLGYLSAGEVKNKLGRTKYLACTSRQEAFGMVVVEGMNAGCRVILNEKSYEDFHHFEDVILYRNPAEISWLKKWEEGCYSSDLFKLQQESVITLYE